MSEAIGFIGLGSMGAAMARRLLETGHELTVWNRSPEPVADLVKAGARPVATPGEACAGEFVISMLSNDAAVDAVFSPSLLASLDRDALHINMASISPAAARQAAVRHADAGIAYVSAPVLGRPPAAAAGQLQVLAAGASDAVERAIPVVEHLAARVWRLGGEPSQANAVKAAMNYMLIHTIQSLGEAIALVERSGIAPAEFVELATSTLFSGSAHNIYGRIISERDFRPAGFAMELGLKDLSLAEQIAEESGLELPFSTVLRKLFEAALADPALNDADWAAVTEVTRRSGRDVA